MPNPHGEGINNCGTNTCTLQGLEMSTISYEDNKPAELNSWDRETLPLSLFINIDTKNISTLLL